MNQPTNKTNKKQTNSMEPVGSSPGSQEPTTDL
jgi:hypothetical protein